MRVGYDSEEDILDIQFKEGTYWKSVELSDGPVIDISIDGELLSIVIPQASKIFSGDMRKVIERAQKAVPQ